MTEWTAVAECSCGCALFAHGENKDRAGLNAYDLWQRHVAKEHSPPDVNVTAWKNVARFERGAADEETP